MTALFGHRYRLLEPLASGGMVDVWRASDELLGRPVAVKLLRPRLLADDVARRRFRREARTAAALLHPNIAQVHDYGEQEDLAYLVVEPVEGESLAGVLRRAGTLDAELVLEVVAQVARGLHAAHSAGIAHGAVEPGNLMIDGRGRVKIIDFGIASACGRPAGPAGDLCALGAVAYECLTGRVPFGAESLPPSVPEGLRALVGRLLGEGPPERPVSAAQVADRADVLRRALIELRAARALLPPQRPVRTGPAQSLAGAAGLGILLLGALLGGSALSEGRDATLTGETADSVSPTETPVTPELTGQGSTSPATTPVGTPGTSVTITTTKTHTEPNPESTTPRALGSDNKV